MRRAVPRLDGFWRRLFVPLIIHAYPHFEGNTQGTVAAFDQECPR
jgi:hypothetical protein